jgi:hypothetical protein
LYWLGNVIKAAKDLDKYVARCDREVDKTSEDSPLIRQSLGLAYAARGQHRQATEQFTAATRFSFYIGLVAEVLAQQDCEHHADANKRHHARKIIKLPGH